MSQSPSPVVEPRFLVESSDINEIVAIVIAWNIDTMALQPGEEGLPSFMHQMLKRGTTRQGAAELAEAIDSLGVSISTSTDDDYSKATLVATRDTWREGLEILREMLLEPAFEPEEIEKERVNTLAALRRADDDLMGFTDRAWHRAAFPGHPLGFPDRGTPETVAAFTRQQIEAMHTLLLSEPPAVVSVSGAVTPEEARAALQPVLWPGVRSDDVPPAPAVPDPNPPDIELNRASNQAFLIRGTRICPYGHPDWIALRVMNTILGEGMSSRLFIHLRDEQGLAYATGSAMSGGKLAGILRGYIGTKPESLDHAQAEMDRQFQRIQNEPVAADELDRAKKYLVGRFLIDHQTNARRAYYPLHFEMMGHGADYGRRYPALVESVTAEDVRRVARRWLSGPIITARLVPKTTSPQPMLEQFQPRS